MNPPGGNHRGSIFRLLAGNALMRRDSGIGVDSWGDAMGAPRHVRLAERPVEELVSRYIGGMSVLFVPVEDAPGPDSERGYIERHSIALLSGFADAAVDPPSPEWLGHHCDRERVRSSGLWNNNHVDERYDPGFLNVLKKSVEAADLT